MESRKSIKISKRGPYKIKLVHKFNYKSNSKSIELYKISKNLVNDALNIFRKVIGDSVQTMQIINNG